MGTGQVDTRLWWGDLMERNHFKRTKRRWEDNIKTDLQEVGWGDIDWIHLAHDRERWWTLANAVMNLRGP